MSVRGINAMPKPSRTSATIEYSSGHSTTMSGWMLYCIERAGARPHPGVLIVSNYRYRFSSANGILPLRQRMILRRDDDKLLVRHREKFHVILFQTAAKAYI